MKKINSKLFTVSMVLGFSSALILPAEKIAGEGYSMGFPVKFLTYYSGQDLVNPRILIFAPKNILSISLNILEFMFCSLVIYVFLFLVYKFVKAIVE